MDFDYGTAIFQLVALSLPFIIVGFIVWVVLALNRINKRLQDIEQKLNKR